MNRQDACSTKVQFSCRAGAAFLGTGKMPVLQKFNFPVGRAQHFYEQARCLFHKSSIFLWGALLARPKNTI